MICQYCILEPKISLNHDQKRLESGIQDSIVLDELGSKMMLTLLLDRLGVGGPPKTGYRHIRIMPNTAKG